MVCHFPTPSRLAVSIADVQCMSLLCLSQTPGKDWSKISSVAGLFQQAAVNSGHCQVAEEVQEIACKTEGNLPPRFGLLLIPNWFTVPSKFC